MDAVDFNAGGLHEVEEFTQVWVVFVQFDDDPPPVATTSKSACNLPSTVYCATHGSVIAEERKEPVAPQPAL